MANDGENQLDVMLRELPMPRVDMRKVSRKWTKALRETMNDAERSQRILNMLEPEGSSIEEIEAFEELYDKYQAKLEEIGQKQAAMVSEIIVSVPGEALDDNAPSDLDWDDPDALDYLRQDVYGVLMVALVQGKLSKLAAKN